MKKASFILLVLVCSFTLVSGQEVLSNLHTNPRLYQGPPKSVRHSRAVPSDTLHLPFNDDFSNKSDYPDTSKWLDNYVYINNTYPVQKLSYGVATFDGLNQYGLAYNDSANGFAAGADTLTSKLIDLSSFAVGDSVYFSFSYEPKGLGDFPDLGDSLILEFSTAHTDTTWVPVWSKNGFAASISNPNFIDVYIALDTLANAQFFFRNDFQFRFRNIATVSGNNDHWHIDYVYLNNTRTGTDIYRNDLTFLDAPGSFLRNYTSMPWSHFYNYQAKELGDSLGFCLVNYFNAPLSPTIQFDVLERRSNTSLPTTPFAGGFTLNSFETRCFDQPVAAFAPINFLPSDTDSVVISPRVFVTPTPGDFYPNNDTVYTDVNFYNYLAYDDGSAEKAYGLAGIGGLKKFAYAFHLNHPDTLRAVLVHFTSIDYDPSNLLYSFYVWKNIDVNNTGTEDDTLYHEDFRRPSYVDQINGFATIKLKTPIVISDSFYVGFTQTSDLNIEIGYDLNTDASSHMYYNANNTWYKSQFHGAVMMRPLIGKSVPLHDTYIDELTVDDNALQVYPNPATNLVYTNFRTEKEGTYTEVYDLSGHLVMKEAYNNLPIDVSNLQSGFYLIRYSRNSQLIPGVGKFVKM